MRRTGITTYTLICCSKIAYLKTLHTPKYISVGKLLLFLIKILSIRNRGRIYGGSVHTFVSQVVVAFN